MSLSYIRQRDARLAVHHGVCRQPLRTTPPVAVSQWEAMRCVCVDRTDPVGARARAAHEHALLHRPWGLARVPKVDVCRRRGARCRWRAVPQWLWSTTTTMSSLSLSPPLPQPKWPAVTPNEPLAGAEGMLPIANDERQGARRSLPAHCARTQRASFPP